MLYYGVRDDETGGDQVRQAQIRLNRVRQACGLPPIDVDGVYGRETADAFFHLQDLSAKMEIMVDGARIDQSDRDAICGPRTLAALSQFESNPSLITGARAALGQPAPATAPAPSPSRPTVSDSASPAAAPIVTLPEWRLEIPRLPDISWKVDLPDLGGMLNRPPRRDAAITVPPAPATAPQRAPQPVAMPASLNAFRSTGPNGLPSLFQNPFDDTAIAALARPPQPPQPTMDLATWAEMHAPTPDPARLPVADDEPLVIVKEDIVTTRQRTEILRRTGLSEAALDRALNRTVEEINTLRPEMRAAVALSTRQQYHEGHAVVAVIGHRTIAEQNYQHRNGFSPLRGGLSHHNYAAAIDLQPANEAGEPNFSRDRPEEGIRRRMRDIWENFGLTTISFRDDPGHVQLARTITRAIHVDRTPHTEGVQCSATPSNEECKLERVRDADRTLRRERNEPSRQQQAQAERARQREEQKPEPRRLPVVDVDEIGENIRNVATNVADRVGRFFRLG